MRLPTIFKAMGIMAHHTSESNAECVKLLMPNLDNIDEGTKIFRRAGEVCVMAAGHGEGQMHIIPVCLKETPIVEEDILVLSSSSPYCTMIGILTAVKDGLANADQVSIALQAFFGQIIERLMMQGLSIDHIREQIEVNSN